MSGYAINAEGGWRTVNSPADVLPGETYSDTQPTITVVEPIIVSPRQIRQALTAENLRTQVEAAVAAGDQNLKDWYQFATQFEENNPQVLAMAQALNVSTDQLHTLFEAAAAL